MLSAQVEAGECDRTSEVVNLAQLPGDVLGKIFIQDLLVDMDRLCFALTCRAFRQAQTNSTVPLITRKSPLLASYKMLRWARDHLHVSCDKMLLPRRSAAPEVLRLLVREGVLIDQTRNVLRCYESEAARAEIKDQPCLIAGSGQRNDRVRAKQLQKFS